MGENPLGKFILNKRAVYFGMIKPILENPDAIVEEESAKSGDEERSTSYVFIKAFRKSDGNRYYYFTSITAQ
jgi:hypothetical protein